MGRTYKRDMDLEDFDDLTPIDDMEDDDSLEWMTRPNETRTDPAGKRGRRKGAGWPLAHRGLPDDWQDFDYAGDTIWR